MEYKIEVNENYSVIDELTHRIKAIKAGDGVITVTAGKFTKSFNFNVVERLLVDMGVNIGENADAELTTVDKITLTSSYTLGNNFEFMFEGKPFEIEATSMMGELNETVVALEKFLEPITMMGENTDDSMMEYDEEI